MTEIIQPLLDAQSLIDSCLSKQDQIVNEEQVGDLRSAPRRPQWLPYPFLYSVVYLVAKTLQTEDEQVGGERAALP